LLKRSCFSTLVGKGCEGLLMNADERAIKEFTFRFAALLALRLAVGFMTAWGFVWGMAVLVLRVAAGTPRSLLLWGLLGVVPAVGLGIILSRRRLPRRQSVRALLDKQSRCGGLFMAAEEADLGSWRARMPAITVPQLTWRSRRPAALLAAASLFVLVGFLIPQRLVSITGGHTLEVAGEIEKLTAQIDVLEQEKILEPTKAESLKDKLEQIRADASGEDPVKTWEALDHLRPIPEEAAAEAAEAAISKTEDLTQAEALAEAVAQTLEQQAQEGEAAMDPKLVSEAMAELSQMVEAAAAQDESLKRRLERKDLQKAVEASELSPEQLEQLANTLRECKGDVADLLQKLSEADLVDLSTLELNGQVGKCDPEGLAAFLKENEGQMSVGEMLAESKEGRPGRGGVDRGRGDAAMTWGDESSEEGTKFKETILPPAALDAAKESVLAGVSAGAPTVETDAAPSEPGALTGAAAGAGSAHTQTVLPRHRGTVRRYFERE
jgi:hypothetical protein